MAATSLAALLFVVGGFFCVLLVIAGLPGAWILLGLAALIELVDPAWAGEAHSTVGWGWIGLGALFAAVGELLEFLSGMAGSKAAGGSRKGMLGAVAGGLVGALVGTVVIPVPIVGTLIGAFGGTFAGALLGEMSCQQGKSWQDSMKPALAATVARAVGIAAKLGICMALWLGLSLAAVTAL